MSKLETRRVLRQDLPELLEMVHLLAAHHGDPPEATQDSLARDLLGPGPWAIGLVAITEDALAGYALLCRRLQAQKGLRGINIHHLFVRERFRGRGCGQMLIHASQMLAKDLGCSGLTVGTHSENAAAAHYYQQLGFERKPQGGPQFLRRF